MTNILAVVGPNSKYKLPNAQPADFWAFKGVVMWH